MGTGVLRNVTVNAKGTDLKSSTQQVLTTMYDNWGKGRFKDTLAMITLMLRERRATVLHDSNT